MEKENRNLKVLVVILCILVLGLGGYFVYDKVLSEDTNNDVQLNSDDNNDIVGNKINNINVSTAHLNEILKIIGVNSMNDNSHSCLNYYLSNDNYSDYAKNIISYYRDAYDVNILKNPPEEVYSSIECGMGAADCYSISKEDANYLYNLYKLDGDISEYFKSSSMMDDQYLFFYNHALGTCNYNVIHSLTSEYVSSTDIVVTDNQVINEYSEPYSEIYDSEKTIVDTYKKEVVYTFKLNESGNYYLNKVNVK